MSTLTSCKQPIQDFFQSLRRELSQCLTGEGVDAIFRNEEFTKIEFTLLPPPDIDTCKIDCVDSEEIDRQLLSIAWLIAPAPCSFSSHAVFNNAVVVICFLIFASFVCFSPVDQLWIS